MSPSTREVPRSARDDGIVDVAPLQELSGQTLAAQTHVFTPKTALQYGETPMEGQSTGHKYWAAPSPAYGAEIAYRIAPGARVQGPVRVAILGPMGDTLRAFANAPSSPGVHRILWDMRDRVAPRPLSPAQRRDSIASARRLIAVVDSLIAAKTIPEAMAPRARAAAAGGPQGIQDLAAAMGGFGGGGGGGGGGGAGARGTVQPVGYPRWAERPGESAPGRGAAAQQSEGMPREGGEGGAPAMDQSGMAAAFQAIQAALRGRGGGGGGGFGGGASLVPTGTYQVAVTINGQTTRVPLRVERVSGSGGAAAFGGEEEEREP